MDRKRPERGCLPQAGRLGFRDLLRIQAVETSCGSAISQHGTFDARTKEAIALAVGNEDGCDYCQAAHTMSGKAAGLTEEQTKAIRAGDIDFDDRLAAITTLARETASNTGSVSEQTWQGVLDAGWSEEERSEAFAHIAVNLYTNYFNHYAGTELDVPAAPELS